MGSPFPCLFIALIALIIIALALFIGISLVVGGAVAIRQARRVDSASQPPHEEPRPQPRKRLGALGIVALIVGVLILYPVILVILAAISTILDHRP